MENDKVIHPNIKDSRVMTYLNCTEFPLYTNTEEENSLLQLWRTKYYIAKEEYERSRANSKMVNLWRNAYEGKFFKLDDNGEVTDVKLKSIRKVAFELVENKVNSNVPSPKMSPRYHADLVPVNITEDLIKHEINHMLSEEINDQAEHHVLIDGTVWFKVMWNPFDNTYERSGNPLVTVCPIDTVFPQPGIMNYKRLEYIFEMSTITVAECIDLYNRNIKSPTQNDIIPIINCYFLNKDRLVGKFTWCEETSQVICNDLEWGIRRRRECTKCGHVEPVAEVCPICGSKDIKYVPVREEVLPENLDYVTNPYRSGTSEDPMQDENMIDEGSGLAAGSTVPFYLLRQLPFVPYKRISVPNSMYGISEVEIILEDQDLINKLLNKAEKKSNSSKTWVTKLKDTNISNDGEEISLVEVESPQEGQSIQVKQIMSDISEEVTQAQLLYDIAKSTVGVTNTDQGKSDSTAVSGKAKQLQMAASQKRNQTPDSMRNLAYSGVYELIFKNLLAFSDELRSYVSMLPDGTRMEEQWSKYMFLNRSDDGVLYYRDDYAWEVDTATEITEDRASMWQLIDNDYINGLMGNQIDPQRALLMYWQMKDMYGYPTAKFAIGFIKDSMKRLPSSVEQVLAENPEAVQLALSYIQDRLGEAGLVNQQSNLGKPIGSSGPLMSQARANQMNAQRGQTTQSGQSSGNAGGARINSGRPGNNGTHAANVEKNNNKNRTQSGAAQTNSTATATGGMQGGTGGA